MPKVVSDTGPIIALAHIGQIDILRRLFGQVLIPPAVQAEIRDETSAAALDNADWIVLEEVKDTLAVQLLRRAAPSSQ